MSPPPPPICDLRTVVAGVVETQGRIHPRRVIRLVLDPRVPDRISCETSDFSLLLEHFLAAARPAEGEFSLCIFETDDPHACVLRFELYGASGGALSPAATEAAARLGAETGFAPTHAPPWFSLAARAVPPPPSPGSVPHFPVLVVEDNAANQRLASECLRHLGCPSVIAENGREGLRLAAEHPFPLILMDVHMPVMDGLTATRAIRALPGPHRPYIAALTAFALPGDKARCLEAGMDDFLTKPCRIDVLEGVVVRAASRRGASPR